MPEFPPSVSKSLARCGASLSSIRVLGSSPKSQCDRRRGLEPTQFWGGEAIGIVLRGWKGPDYKI